MPPKALKNVIADSTDPATLRPDLPQTASTGRRFKPMDLPDFPLRINLPPDIMPKDAWKIFQLFWPVEQMQIIIDNTNDYANRPYYVQKAHARAHRWISMTVEEGYAYLGIRIYIGVNPQNKLSHYWRDEPEKPLLRDVIASMSLLRFEAIHRALRMATDEPNHEFESVFDRVRSTILDRGSLTNLFSWNPS